MGQKLSFAFLAAAIIAILGLFQPTVPGPSTQRIAKIQMANIGAAVIMLHYDVGRYPTAAEGLQPLIRNTGDWPSWRGPYLRNAEIPLDPWHRPYVYSCCDEHGEFELLSYGRDGKPGGRGDDADIRQERK